MAAALVAEQAAAAAAAAAAASADVSNLQAEARRLSHQLGRLYGEWTACRQASAGLTALASAARTQAAAAAALAAGPASSTPAARGPLRTRHPPLLPRRSSGGRHPRCRAHSRWGSFPAARPGRRARPEQLRAGRRGLRSGAAPAPMRGTGATAPAAAVCRRGSAPSHWPPRPLHAWVQPCSGPPSVVRRRCCHGPPLCRCVGCRSASAARLGIALQLAATQVAYPPLPHSWAKPR